jgi:hypothetical protein
VPDEAYGAVDENLALFYVAFWSEEYLISF